MTNFPFESREAYFAAVVDIHKTYEPAPDVLERIHKVHETTITGASGAGKDTIRQKAIGLAATEGIEIKKIVSNTDREPRENDGVMEEDGKDYWFVDMQTMYDDIMRGRLVQWVPNKKLQNVYGSSDLAYPEEGFAVVDVAASALPNLREHRDYYASLASAGLVVESGEKYLYRLKKRGTLSPEAFEKRLQEGVESLALTLEDPEMHLILNDDLDRSAKEFMDFALRRDMEATDQKRAKKCAGDMLKVIRMQLGRIAPVSLYIPDAAQTPSLSPHTPTAPTF